jgi:hypothetical protein
MAGLIAAAMTGLRGFEMVIAGLEAWSTAVSERQDRGLLSFSSLFHLFLSFPVSFLSFSSFQQLGFADFVEGRARGQRHGAGERTVRTGLDGGRAWT